MPNPIKQKFIDHMELYQLSKQTQKGYISGVRCLAKHYNTSPEYLSNDQVREYFRHLLLEKKLAHSSCKAYLAGITYFYRHICDREVDDRFGLPPPQWEESYQQYCPLKKSAGCCSTVSTISSTGSCSRPSAAPGSGSG